MDIQKLQKVKNYQNLTVEQLIIIREITDRVILIGNDVLHIDDNCRKSTFSSLTCLYNLAEFINSLSLFKSLVQHHDHHQEHNIEQQGVEE